MSQDHHLANALSTEMVAGTKGAAESRLQSNLKELRLNILAGSMCTAFSVALWNPLDTIRIRWQVAPPASMGSGIVGFSREIVRSEGLVRGLWIPGCGAHASAVAISSGVRLGFYPTLRDMITGDKEKDALSMWLAGFLAGAVGFTIANPFFQAKVRLQVTANQPDRPYRSLSDCLHKIGKNEGLTGLFRGSSTLMVRGALLSAGAQLGYDYVKTDAKARGFKEGPMLHAVASVSSAFLASTFSAPCDYIMTRYQSAPAQGVQYRGIADCVGTILKEKGALELWRGWLPLFVRLGPLWMMNMPLYEATRRLLGLEYMN